MLHNAKPDNGLNIQKKHEKHQQPKNLRVDINPIPFSVRLAHDRGLTLLLIATAHVRLGRTDEAVAAYRSVIDMRSDFAARARHHTSGFVLNEVVLEQMLADFTKLAQRTAC